MANKTAGTPISVVLADDEPVARMGLRAMLATNEWLSIVGEAGSVIPVPVASVEWFEASGDYVAAHTANSRYLLHLSLNRLEERLDPRRFVRIHRTHLANLDHVIAFRRQGKDRLMAELRDGTRLPVSRDRAKELRGLGA